MRRFSRPAGEPALHLRPERLTPTVDVRLTRGRWLGCGRRWGGLGPGRARLRDVPRLAAVGPFLPARATTPASASTTTAATPTAPFPFSPLRPLAQLRTFVPAAPPA